MQSIWILALTSHLMQDDKPIANHIIVMYRTPVIPVQLYTINMCSKYGYNTPL